MNSCCAFSMICFIFVSFEFGLFPSPLRRGAINWYMQRNRHRLREHKSDSYPTRIRVCTMCVPSWREQRERSEKSAARTPPRPHNHTQHIWATKEKIHRDINWCSAHEQTIGFYYTIAGLLCCVAFMQTSRAFARIYDIILCVIIEMETENVPST